MSEQLRRPVVLGLLAALLAGLYLLAWLQWIPQPTEQTHPSGGNYGFTTTYDPPRRPVEVAANSGDGQVFAAMAMDPSMSRPEAYRWGPGEMAYRLQRPLAGYAAWALSAGQPGPVPYVLGLLTVFGVGVFVGSVAALARHLGRDPLLASLLVIAPGVIADLRWLCPPDVLAAGLAIAGLVLWARGERTGGYRWGAVAVFALAVLTRETAILVPIAAGVDGLLRRTPIRRLMPLAVIPALHVAWLVVVHARIGTWPTDADIGTRISLPFQGMVDGLSHGSSVSLWLAVATFALGIAGLVRSRDELIRCVIVFQLLFALVMGPSVWEGWYAYARLLLPMIGVALAAVLPGYPSAVPLGERDGQGTEAGADPVPVGA